MTVEGLQLLNNMGAIQALLCFFFCFLFWKGGWRGGHPEWGRGRCPVCPANDINNNYFSLQN